MNRFLLEIGCEEIPDWMIVPALNQLQDYVQTLVDQNALSGRVTRVDATPRRLVLWADGLMERQKDSEELVLGPPKSAGAGAAAGFAKKMGVAAAALVVQSTAKGEYFSVLKKAPGRTSRDVLASALPELILKIQWPKTMYWTGKGGVRFIRPIRWLVALLEGEVVEFEIANVKSGNLTFGHRLAGRDPIPVTISNFEAQLEEHGVIVSAAKRRERIEKGIGNHLVQRDPALLDTLVYITELPTPILGSFDPEYLRLPREVLSTVMRHHQKYFSVEDADGKLAPQFIAVMNTSADPDGLVRQGNERVLRARFNDARFFWEHDLKRALEDRLEDLRSVTFQAQLGSYYEKALRVESLAQEICRMEHSMNPWAIQRSALLCKCDLTTDMVKEFTELQGIIGGLYAQEQGEPDEVWRAIYQHYKPVGPEDGIPEGRYGRALALADKMDTLRECFKVDLIPTGSKDPLGLRRAALGVVRIIIEGGIDFPMHKVTAGDHRLEEFLLERAKYYFREIKGYPFDEISAAMKAIKLANLLDLDRRLSELHKARSSENFQALASSFKRIKNILRQAGHEPILVGEIDESLLEPGAERALFDAHASIQGQVYLFASEEDYYNALLAIASLRPAVDLFFDKVLVNAPDQRIRTNRLTLLSNLLTEFSTIADFSEIVTEKT